ncbi:MAG: TonB-dependent receptor [Williamsia sp.]|nr:TonB-dependent receptor [Williamsia sp.]
MKKVTFLVLLLLGTCTMMAQSRLATGKVVDSLGKGISGVTVSVTGTKNAVQTDEQGNFTVPLPNGRNELKFSSVGYNTQVVKTGRTPLTVSLQAIATSLEDYVVIGYGVVKKRDLTGSVSSVKGEEITKVPTQNPLESIQGKVPGADITRSNGSATSGVNITIRGNRSIGGSNSPLYVIDGVQTGSIADINPNDIESIDFLKDASSTAIYGFQGANGIVIITTKKGKAGTPKVTFNSYTGVSQVSRYPSSMTGPDYVKLKREAYRTANKWSSVADDPKIFNNQELAAIQKNQWVDYQKELIKTGRQQDYQLGVSAGSEKTKVYFSLDYYNEKGILKQDWLNRYSARLNIDQTINNWIKAGLQGQVTYRDQSVRRDPLNQANKINPLGTVYDSTGKFILYPLSGSAVNPLADEQPNVYSNKVVGTNVVTNAYIEVKPFADLTLRSNLGTNLTFSRTGLYESSASIDRNGSPALASYTTSNSRFYNWDNILTYRKQIKEHSITVTALTSYLYSAADNVSAQGQGQLLPSQLFYALGNAPSNVAVNSGYTKSNTFSVAGRLNYSYMGKYLLTLTNRADGASRLSAGHKWTSFPSAAFAWRISDENFMKTATIISDLKLRVSYGVAGNSSVPVYGTQSSLTRVAFAYGDVSAQGFTFSPLIGNQELGWELSKTPDLGVDIGFFNNRLSATIDVYDTRTSNLLLPRGLPPTSGVLQVYQNIGKTRNRGIEIGINTVNIRNKDLTWTSSITYSRNKEQIVSLVTDTVNDIGNGWFIGRPVSVFYDYQKAGIWQTKEAAEAQKYGQAPGDIHVRDLNGDGKIDATNDRTVVGTPRPKWYGGISNTVRYKGFDLNVYVFARIGQMINPDFLRRFSTQGLENSSAVVDYWTPEYASNNYPRPNANLSLASMLYTSTIGYVDGSYVRLRNISLGYTFPKFRKSFISDIRIYATGNNLLTFTKESRLKDYDPERGGSENFPMTKTVVAGVNVGF